MDDTNQLQQIANEQLLKTSRTFFIPISQLSDQLWDAVAAAYLCMRAIDEIEDHPTLESEHKIRLLRSISKILKDSPADAAEKEITELFLPYRSLLPEVTLMLIHWMCLAPESIRNEIYLSTAQMADGMAYWVDKQWNISSAADLDDYTFYVAGLVGILLSKIWMWHDQLNTDKELAISFGRGLQAVNMIRNREEDLHRGVDYFPQGWGLPEMLNYAKRNLKNATRYIEQLPAGAIHNFCQIPLILANATLNTIVRGGDKLSRTNVMELVKPYIQ